MCDLLINVWSVLFAEECQISCRVKNCLIHCHFPDFILLTNGGKRNSQTFWRKLVVGGKKGKGYSNLSF